MEGQKNTLVSCNDNVSTPVVKEASDTARDIHWQRNWRPIRADYVGGTLQQRHKSSRLSGVCLGYVRYWLLKSCRSNLWYSYSLFAKRKWQQTSRSQLITNMQEIVAHYACFIDVPDVHLSIAIPSCQPATISIPVQPCDDWLVPTNASSCPTT